MTKYIRDYYRILRVNKNANQNKIKRAYKRTSKKYHPDTSNVKNAEKKYLLIQEAYSVLSDQKKREKYDKLYDEAMKKKSKKLDINNTINYIKDVEDNYGIMSKGVGMIVNTLKSQPLTTGTKLLFGGAVTGMGVNQGRKYINKKLGQKKGF